ncbi:MAG: Gfo/Idh/MocA family oxidoreductase [Anaerolineae bacterium]
MMQVGILGCGNIAPAYLKGLSQHPEDVRAVACADLVPEKAQDFAAKHSLQALSIEALLNHPEIDIIINLTVPAVHSEVSLQIIEAGKHVYSEKPLGLTRKEGESILQAARNKGVRVGCAPDTFLGAGGQTARHLIDQGVIGTPVSASAFFMSHGPESWHPNPFFFYQPGAGPLFDMGPYYLTALVHLLGPIESLSAVTSRAFSERVAGHETIRGQRIPVNVDTHYLGLLRFASGVVANMNMSFDVWQHTLPRIEVYGTQGSMLVPDPNTFKGPVSIWTPEREQWEDQPLIGDPEALRGAGVADMARGIAANELHRASGDLALHVLDAMVAFGEAAASGQHVKLTTTVQRPALWE